MDSKKHKKLPIKKNSKNQGANNNRLGGSGKFTEIEIRKVESNPSKNSKENTSSIELTKSTLESSSHSKKSDLSDASEEVVISDFRDKSSSSSDANEKKQTKNGKRSRESSINNFSDGNEKKEIISLRQNKESSNNNLSDSTDQKMDDYKLIALTKWVDIKDKPVSNLKDSVRQSFVDEVSDKESSDCKNLDHSKTDGSPKSSPQVNNNTGGRKTNRITHKKDDDSTDDEGNEPYSNYIQQSCSLPTLTGLRAPNGIEKLKRQLMGKLLEGAMCRRKSKWSFRRKCCKQPPPPLPIDNTIKGCVIQQILHYNDSDEDMCYTDSSEEDCSNASVRYNSTCCDSFHHPCASNKCISPSKCNNNYYMQNQCGQMPSCFPSYYNPYYCSGYCYPQYGNSCFNPYSRPMETNTSYCSCSRPKNCKCCVEPNENNCKIKHCSFSSQIDIKQCSSIGEPFEAYYPQMSEETVCYNCKAVPSNTSGRACCSRSDKIKLLQNSNSYISIKSEIDKNELCNVDNEVD